jgi:hypothetical protein
MSIDRLNPGYARVAFDRILEVSKTFVPRKDPEEMIAGWGSDEMRSAVALLGRLIRLQALQDQPALISRVLKLPNVVGVVRESFIWSMKDQLSALNAPSDNYWALTEWLATRADAAVTTPASTPSDLTPARIPRRIQVI